MNHDDESPIPDSPRRKNPFLDALENVEQDSARVLRDVMKGPQTRSFSPLSFDDPEQIGPYRILERIGEGGMGVVYAAEQREPVKRKVAIKVIKYGMDTKAVIARFEAERQALALMDHPAIAKVFDAGATDQGRPYFVMEYVSGEPLTDYCDRHRLDTNERLELFAQICSAIQHAHQKGVIHRDLKPSNILVEIRDSLHYPKVIDFGLAKSTQHTLTERTLFTELGQILGTPEYMSPEQAEMSQNDVDTRTDLYSLGVVLYELLTGALPFDSKVLREGGYAEIQRIIRESEPPKPSTRLSGIGADSEVLAAARSCDLKSLRRKLRGDLDWIVLKCLEKDRTRRYATASELQHDLQRYLNHEPVSASPPSTRYRLSKFVRKHRSLVTVATVVFVALSLGLAVASYGLVQEAQRARELAESKADLEESNRTLEATNQELAQAKDNLERANGELAISNRDLERANAELEQTNEELGLVAAFQSDQFSEIDSEQMGVRLRQALIDKTRAAQTRTQKAEEEIAQELDQVRLLTAETDFVGLALSVFVDNVFSQTEAAIESQFENRPELQAKLFQSLASTLSKLGLYDSARSAQVRAVEIFRRAAEAGSEILSAQTNLAAILTYLDEFERAEALFRNSLAQQTEQFGERGKDTLTTRGYLTRLLIEAGRWEEAEENCRETLRLRTEVLGPEDPETLVSMNTLGQILMELGRFSEARPVITQVLEKRRRVLGETHRQTLSSINTIALFWQRQGNLREAEPFFREQVELKRKKFGDDHPRTLIALGNLARLLKDGGKVVESEALFKETVTAMARVLGPEHRETLISQASLGQLYCDQGKFDLAEQTFREVLASSLRVLGKDHPHCAIVKTDLALPLIKTRQFEESGRLLEEALDQNRDQFGEVHPRTVLSLTYMGMWNEYQGRYAEAEPYLLRSMEIRRKLYGPKHPETLAAINAYANLLVSQRMYEESEPYFRELLAATRKILGPKHPHTLSSVNNLGALLHRLRKFDEAEPYLREALDARRKMFGDIHPKTVVSVYNMGGVLLGQKKYAEAEAYFRESLDGYRKIYSDHHPETWKALDSLAETLSSLGEYDEAHEISRALTEEVAQDRGHDDPLLGSYLKTHGETYMAQQKHAEADRSFEKAHAIYLKAFGPHDERTLDVIYLRARNFEGWDRLEPDSGYAERSQELKAILDESSSR